MSFLAPALVLTAALSLGLSGCSSHANAKSPTGPSAGAPATGTANAALPDTAPAPGELTLSQWQHVGRVLDVDAASKTVIVEVVGYAPPFGAGQEWWIRSPDLRIVAHLEVGRQQKGRFVGCRVIEGQPRIGDEVVSR